MQPSPSCYKNCAISRVEHAEAVTPSCSCVYRQRVHRLHSSAITGFGREAGLNECMQLASGYSSRSGATGVVAQRLHSVTLKSGCLSHSTSVLPANGQPAHQRRRAGGVKTRWRGRHRYAPSDRAMLIAVPCGAWVWHNLPPSLRDPLSWQSSKICDS